MTDYVIKGGTLVDGTGASPATGDIAVADGVITEVGGTIEPGDAQVIDADGALVTPGWVDVHTHYDGQVSWDAEMDPSASNGVSTIVMGNCGVGFAPVPAGGEKELIELMEGVEDIPGTALYEGMEWGNWETFPEFLDYLGSRSYAIDVAAQIPHGAVRYYVMGERGSNNEDATAEDLDSMSAIVTEALQAGAVGFSTSRTIGHMSITGKPVPGTFAADDELLAIAKAMGAAGKGVFEMIAAGTLGPLEQFGGEQNEMVDEHELMAQFSLTSNRPVTYTLVPLTGSDEWRNMMKRTEEANAAGAQLRPQVASRPIGFLTGLNGYHAFQRRPSYMRIAQLPLPERVREMARPEVREAIMSEADVPVELPGSMENTFALFQASAPLIYPCGDPVDYEPELSDCLGARAAAEGRDPLEVMYDFLLEDEGRVFGALMGTDMHAHQECLRELLLHPMTVTGLSDAGAHVTLICDGSAPSTQLTHWTRDRHRGEQLPVEWLVKKQTSGNADLYGFTDRGRLAPGLRADINVIDHANLTVGPPKAHHDLPAGGTRLMQPVSGYLANFVGGELTRRHDEPTGAYPGRLART